jgi:hypothetical protein
MPFQGLSSRAARRGPGSQDKEAQGASDPSGRKINSARNLPTSAYACEPAARHAPLLLGATSIGGRSSVVLTYYKSRCMNAPDALPFDSRPSW